MNTRAHFRCFSFVAVIVTALLLWVDPARSQAAEWQWSVPVSSVTSSESDEHPRAFLWIPPTCERVRGVVVGQHNMEEEPILEHPKFRAALAELGFAEVWVSPGFDLFFRFDRGAGDHFNSMMRSLAEESGYAEIERAPVVPIGHSAAASFPWNFAAWNPARTIAAISISGQWPFFKDPSMPDWAGRSIDGVPGLVTMGEYEAAEQRAGEGLKQRAQHPNVPLSMLPEPGGGHFDVSDPKVDFLAFYLKKAAQHRLSAAPASDATTALKPIDPTKQGWLIERWHADRGPGAPAAPVESYRGKPGDAFWCFDEEHARATETFTAAHRGKKPQLAGYLQAGKVVPQDAPFTHQQVSLPFIPEADGQTFRLSGTFLDRVPAGRPEKWTGKTAGAEIEHSTGATPVSITRICGPVKQTSPDTFAISFYRMGVKNRKRSNEIWLLASHPGDRDYKRAVQQAVLRFPLRNTQGAAQRITFPAIADQPAKPGATIKLEATSDSGAPMQYYVLAGPAEIEGDTLRLTPLPPRAKFPAKVTVVAWQWGRSIEPRLQTADPVECSFLLAKPSH